MSKLLLIIRMNSNNDECVPNECVPYECVPTVITMNVSPMNEYYAIDGEDAIVFGRVRI